MKLIVGLGNIGKEYESTRHNIGFMVIDELIKEKNLVEKEKNLYSYSEYNENGEKIILCKPKTYMNNSGNAVYDIMNFYKLNAEDVLIIYDDSDMYTGKVKIKQKGSSAGHRGIDSIINNMKTQVFTRIKIGIRPENNASKAITFVLKPFSKKDKEEINFAINKSIAIIKDFVIDNDPTFLMNKYN